MEKVNTSSLLVIYLTVLNNAIQLGLYSVCFIKSVRPSHTIIRVSSKVITSEAYFTATRPIHQMTKLMENKHLP